MSAFKKGILSSQSELQLPFDWYVNRGQGEIDTVIIAGIHGDENYTLASTQAVIDAELKHLPGTLYIPLLSPQAARSHTRETNGLDLNRQFFPGTQVPEAAGLMQLIQDISERQQKKNGKRGRIKRVLTIHGDIEADEVYVYINGKMPKHDYIEAFRKDMQTYGIPLLHDKFDDTSDAALQNKVIRGIVEQAESPGSLESWLVSEKLADTVICAEIPYRISSKLQHMVNESIVNRFVIGRLS